MKRADRIPADRIRPILRKAMLDYGSLYDIARITGLPDRRLRKIANGGQDNVAVETVDTLLTRLDLVYLWHLPQAKGGLEDIYTRTNLLPEKISPRDRVALTLRARGWSYPAIGRELGLHHTTVMNICDEDFRARRNVRRRKAVA